MFNSKSFAIIIVLTLLALASVVTIQYMEMQEYDLVDKLYREFFSSAKADSEPAAPEQEKRAEEPAEPVADESPASEE